MKKLTAGVGAGVGLAVGSGVGNEVGLFVVGLGVGYICDDIWNRSLFTQDK